MSIRDTTVDRLDIVLFGGTGDLAMRKLIPAFFQLHRNQLLGEDVRIIGVGRTRFDRAGYVDRINAKCRGFISKGFEEDEWARFLKRFDYCVADVTDGRSWVALVKTLQDYAQRQRIFYLSLASRLFVSTCRLLSAWSLVSDRTRVVLEKPLGHNLESFCDINSEVERYFNEQQIFRIDHYLGKTSVQNLLVLRFGNTPFEPLWRREWIRDVQITVAEQIGVETRGEFYDHTGALRDMVQNHLLQLLCIVAMEPPTAVSPDAVRAKKVELLRSLRPIEPRDSAAKTVRGQYRAGTIAGQPVSAYQEEPKIATGSQTETFVAVKAEIDTERWAGVPFYLRTGKRMSSRVAEIVVNFRQGSPIAFDAASTANLMNRMVIRMHPEETVRLHLLASRRGDDSRPEEVAFNPDLSETFRGQRLDGYERMLIDVMRNNLTLFLHRDEQEAAWQWVESILTGWDKTRKVPEPYAAGTWGPAASAKLLSRDGCVWNEEM